MVSFWENLLNIWVPLNFDGIYSPAVSILSSEYALCSTLLGSYFGWLAVCLVN